MSILVLLFDLLLLPNVVCIFLGETKYITKDQRLCEDVANANKNVFRFISPEAYLFAVVSAPSSGA